MNGEDGKVGLTIEVDLEGWEQDVVWREGGKE